MERLLHYSMIPLIAGYNTVQRDHFKPKGLWVSVEGKDDWRSWCESESFGVDRYTWQTAVELTGVGKPILRLDITSLDDFTHEYGGNNYRDCSAIDWTRLASRYGGVIIAPYSWHHRMELMWYYSWDCASGCLWDADTWRIGAPSVPVDFRKYEAEAA